MKLLLPASLLLALLTPCVAAQSTLTVPAQHPTIQAAIDAAAGGDTVLVSPGTWLEQIDYRGKAITVQSEFGLSVTTIHGSNLGIGVRFVTGEGPTSILRGFSVVAGRSVATMGGGGVLCIASSPTIEECRFSGNVGLNGGAVYAVNSPGMTIRDCEFLGNTAVLRGGAIFCTSSILTVSQCLFTVNDAGIDGGALAATASTVAVTDSHFLDNLALNGGGAMFFNATNATVTASTCMLNAANAGGAIRAILSATVVFSSCMVVQNTADTFGGGIDSIFGNVAIVACTVCDNVADTSNGGVSGAGTNISISSSIIRGNTPNQVGTSGLSTTTIDYSNVEGGSAGTSNIDVDPLFVSATGGNYRLLTGSLCIDAGDTSAAGLSNTDFEGDPRVVAAVVDMGADEFVAPSGPVIGRDRPTDVRLMTYNVHQNSIFPTTHPVQAAKFARIVAALDPDIVTLQEIFSSTTACIALMNAIAPLSAGASWYGFRALDCMTLSKFPLSMNAVATIPAGDRQLALSLVDLPDTDFPFDLYLLNNHYICCGGPGTALQRQKQSDAIINWMRDARTPGGLIDLPAGTAMAVVGDLNAAGLQQHVTTLISGDIQDETTYGPDSAPDWDGTPSQDAAPHHNVAEVDSYTWRDDSSPAGPARLDFVIFTDSVLSIPKKFVLNTTAMSATVLAQTGLQSFDVTLDNAGVVFDHLPLIVDFRPAAAAFPGTADDFILTSQINGQGNPFASFSSALVGDTLSIVLDSPGGSLVGGLPVLLAQIHPPSSPPVGLLGLPMIHLDPTASAWLYGAIPGPFGPPLLPASGVALLYQLPPFLAGNAIRLQSFLVSPQTLNGLFAATAAHDILMQ